MTEHPASRPSPRLGPLECAVYRVPTDRPEADGTLAWSDTTVVVVTAHAGGREGLGWTYAGAGSRQVVLHELTSAVEGLSAMDVPLAFEQMVRVCRNLGRQGAVSSAISAVDVALWDLKARLLGVTLADLFGRCRTAVPLYGSGGFTTYDEAATTEQVERWLEAGMRWVKIKIGESWGTQSERDVDRVALVRTLLGDGVGLLVDANGGYSRKEAVRIGRLLTADYDVVWFEEPVSSDDLEGLRAVRDLVTADVTAGEYGYDEAYFQRMLQAGAVDCLQVDATRCGGYTAFLRAAAVAATHQLQVSAHCAPNLHAPVAAAVPNLRHVEYFHDHSRLDPLLFDGVAAPVRGTLRPEAGEEGHGFRLRGSDAEAYRVA